MRNVSNFRQSHGSLRLSAGMGGGCQYYYNFKNYGQKSSRILRSFKAPENFSLSDAASIINKSRLDNRSVSCFEFVNNILRSIYDLPNSFKFIVNGSLSPLSLKPNNPLILKQQTKEVTKEVKRPNENKGNSEYAQVPCLLRLQ